MDNKFNIGDTVIYQSSYGFLKEEIKGYMIDKVSNKEKYLFGVDDWVESFRVFKDKNELIAKIANDKSLN